jgi:hypothetical protein
VISGYFDSRSSRPVPRVRVAIYIPGITAEWKVIDFLVDTGAMMSCVHPSDATLVLGIDSLQLQDPSRWGKHRPAQGIGGGSLDFLMPAAFAMLQDNRAGVDLFEQEIAIAQSLPGVNDELPSLLGWDILERYRLLADWGRRELKLILPTEQEDEP